VVRGSDGVSALSWAFSTRLGALGWLPRLHVWPIKALAACSVLWGWTAALFKIGIVTKGGDADTVAGFYVFITCNVSPAALEWYGRQGPNAT
jgi:hypothetical protein